jgi:hypothetical protein
MRKVTIVALLVLGHAAFAAETGSQPTVDGTDGGFTLAKPTPIPLQEQVRDFDLEANSQRATHILVVDASGRILDIWKGNARLGDVVPLDKLLSSELPKLTDTRETRHAWLSDTGHYWYDLPFRRDRMILFLVQAPARNPVDLREQRGQRLGFRIEIGYHFDWFEPDIGDDWLSKSRIPLTPKGWSACSMTFVDDLGRVRAPGRVHVCDWLPFCRYSGGRQHTVPIWKGIGVEADVERKVWNALHRGQCTFQ